MSCPSSSFVSVHRMIFCNNILLQGVIDRSTIEEYVELEKEISAHEAESPALILQQKKNQLIHLEERIKQQKHNVEALSEQT